MIDLPGSIRLKASFLQEFATSCHDCYKGWIYVGYGQQNGKLKVYKFPCACTVTNGKKLWECLNEKKLRIMVPDDLVDLNDIPPYVLVRSIDLPYKLNLHKIIQEVPF